MKKLQLVVFTTIFLFSSAILANGLFSLGQQGGVQSYQSAVEPANTNKSTARSTSTPPSVVASPQMANVALNKQTTHQLESELNQLSQQSLLYNQQVNQRIEGLSAQGASIRTKLKQLTQAIILLNQQLSTIKLNQQKQLLMMQSSEVSSVPKHHYSLSQMTPYMAFALTLLLAIMIGVLMIRQQRDSRNTVRASPKGKKMKVKHRRSEDNHLVSSMNMEDSVGVRRALEDIVREGDSQQCEMAKAILTVLQENKKVN